MKIIPGLFARVGRIIDLGGDFRLKDPALYEQYYGKKHTAPHLLAGAVYGLPELHRASLPDARLVANPGCYPTGALLALLPAISHGVIAREGIVINALSGVSGAGRSASVEMSFAEVNENVRAYKIGTHQHIPEIEAALSAAAGEAVTLSFVPHLLPITRGIYTTIHASCATRVTDAEIAGLYTEFYRDHPFVRITQRIPQIQSVVRTNFCDIGLFVDHRTGQLIITSVIDNLVKGAAGQAVQNMNLMFSLAETTGLQS
jgi:N-acetyl-gamma-glutamyl-phosphate reductase